MTKSRRWDGEPESEADRKFFDLRASGYRGPIDEKGNAVDEHEMRRRADERRS